MAINYRVKSSIIDITKDRPQSSDRFLVDTNVWYWQTYSRASLRIRSPSNNQVKNYSEYIDSAIGAGATLYRCPHVLVELSSIIESAEAEIYQISNNLSNLDLKVFRHSRSDILQKYRDEVESCWSQIETVTSLLDQHLDNSLCTSFLDAMKTQTLDGYDKLLLMVMRENGITRIITDDGDFSTVEDITVHTANLRVVQTALRSSKLLPYRFAKQIITTDNSLLTPERPDGSAPSA